MALFLCLFIIFGILSCAEGETKSGNTGDQTTAQESEETQNMDFVAEIPEENFNGATFTFLVMDDPCFRHLYDVDIEEMDGDAINDAIFNRNRFVEERLGVEIKAVKGGGNADKQIATNISTGDNAYQASWLKVDNFFSQAMRGSFYDLNATPHINLDKLYWDQNVVRDFTIGGKLYGIMGDMSTSVSIFTHLFGVNKKIAENYNISVDDMYQTVRDGKWTIDKMLEIFSVGIYSDLNGNSKRDGLDQFAFGVSPAVFEAMFSGAGEKWITKDSDDNLVLSPLTERMVSVFEKIVSLTADKQMTLGTWNIGSVQGVSNTYGYVYEDKFINNTSFIVDIDLGIMMDYRKKMDDDFGIVPIPKYEESQPVYSVYAYPFFPLLSVPITEMGESLEMTGMVLEALAEQSYKTLTPVFYDLAISGKYTRDEASVEMLDLILRSRIYDPLYFNAWSGDLRGQLSSQLTSEKLNIASAYAKSESKLVAQLESVVNQFRESE